MGCACKVNQQIGYVQKKYGDKRLEGKETDIRGNVRTFLKKGFFLLLSLPFYPLWIIFVITRRAFTNKPIDIYKIFKIGKKK